MEMLKYQYKYVLICTMPIAKKNPDIFQTFEDIGGSVFIWLTKPVWLTGFLKKNGFGYLNLNNRLTGYLVFFKLQQFFPILGNFFTFWGDFSTNY